MSFFGPNDIGPHHRGLQFTSLLRDALIHLRQLAPEYLPVIVTGSGTTALDLVQDAFGEQRVRNPELPFASRIHRSLMSKGKLSLDGVEWAVQYDPEVCTPDLAPAPFVDAVSAFPYYVPTATSGFVTVSSKQLGGAPVLGVVYLRPEIAAKLPATSRLAALYAYAYDGDKMKSQPFTPNTPAVPLIQSLIESLDRFSVAELRKKCDVRRATLGSLVEGSGPVCRTRVRFPAHLEPYQRDEFTRFFLWSGTDEQFEIALDYLRRNT